MSLNFTSNSTGISTFTFNEDVSTSLQTGDTFYAVISTDDDFEGVHCTYLGSLVFSRDTVEISSNANTLVNFSSGVKDVLINLKPETKIRNETGVTIANNGISFDGTNFLGTHQQGTWTPTLIGDGSNPTVTYSFQEGLYIRTGNLVYIMGSLGIGTISGGSGNALIDGLPFTVSFGPNFLNYPMWACLYRHIDWNGGQVPIMWANDGTNQVQLSASVANGYSTNIQISGFVPDVSEIWFSGSYITG